MRPPTGANRIAGPDGSEAERERLRFAIAGSGESEDAAALVSSHLRDDVSCGSETVQTETLRFARHRQRPVADQPRAHPRRERRGRLIGRQLEAVPAVGDGLFRVAAVDLIAREPRGIAQVFAAGFAEATRAARPPQPRHTHAVADRDRFHLLPGFNHDADDFVSGHDRQSRLRQFAVHHVQIRPAHSARFDSDQNVTRPHMRLRARGLSQRSFRSVELHDTHGGPSCGARRL
jgi:hypothetical protein